MPEYQTSKNTAQISSVLITGGSGLIGKYLTSLLLSKGITVSHLSRKVNQFGKVRVFRWDPEKRIIDPVIFEGVDCLIHLAGANIGESRWTKKRKAEIYSSRVDTAKFLHQVISDNGIPLKTYISASAAGYYGMMTSDKIFQEDDLPATDFLGTLCRDWEESADLFMNMGIRTVKIRTAVVLEKNDSALSKLMKSGRYGFLVQAGSGSQFMPWIHIKDLCRIYLQAVEDPGMKGSYNAVSPGHVSHKEFIRTLADIMNRQVLFPPLPDFILRALLGEMSDVILKGSRLSSEKIIQTGFCFEFKSLKDALRNVLE